MYFIGLLIEGVKATLLDIGVGLISAPLLGIMAVVDKASCEKKEKLYERHPQNSHLFIFRKVNEHPHGKKSPIYHSFIIPLKMARSTCSIRQRNSIIKASVSS